ncbi:MAG: Slp family lipoprotein [Geobacteraceae bacterium]
MVLPPRGNSFSGKKPPSWQFPTRPYHLDFQPIHAKQEAKGSYFAGVLRGGIVAALHNTSKGGEIEIAQQVLDFRGRPENSVVPAGRFLAITEAGGDPATGRGSVLPEKVSRRRLRNAFQQP